MAAAILYFGRDILECFPLLRRRGHSIHFFERAASPDQLRQAGIEYDLVSSADIESDECRHAAEEARALLLVPSIFFQTRTAIQLPRPEPQSANEDHSHHDLVISTDKLPQVWMPELEALIEKGRRLRSASKRIIANSIRLQFETAAAIEKTHLEMRRAKLQPEQNVASSAISNVLPDRVLRCKACGADFVFSTAEQLFSQVHNSLDPPEICQNCMTLGPMRDGQSRS